MCKLRLAVNVVTPTTKAADHDVPISPAEIVVQGLMSQEDWDTVRNQDNSLSASKVYMITEKIEQAWGLCGRCEVL